MKKLRILVITCITLGVLFFIALEYKRFVSAHYVKYRWTGMQVELIQFLHLYEAEQLAVQVDANFNQRGVICLCGTLSMYAEMKKDGLIDKYRLVTDENFKKNLRKAIGIVNGQDLVRLSIRGTERNVQVETNTVLVDFSFLLGDAADADTASDN